MAYSIPDVVAIRLPMSVANLLLFGAFVGLWRAMLKRMGPPVPNSFGTRRPIGVTIICWFFIVSSVISLPTGVWICLWPPDGYPSGFTKRLWALAGFLIAGVTGVFMLKGCNWARWFYVIWTVISAALSLITMGLTPWLFLIVFINVIVITVLFQDTSSSFFTEQP